MKTTLDVTYRKNKNYTSDLMVCEDLFSGQDKELHKLKEKYL